MSQWRLAFAEGREVGKQKSWHAEAKAARLLGEADQVSRARLLVTSRREIGLWLHTLRTSTIGTLLDSESLCIALALRVGADVCEPHMRRCSQRMDARGLHGFSCKFRAGRHARHAALNDIIKRGPPSAGVPFILEPVKVNRGDGKRPDGITLFLFSNGISLCWIAACRDPYADTNIHSFAVSVGHAAREAEERKRRKYGVLGSSLQVSARHS